MKKVSRIYRRSVIVSSFSRDLRMRQKISAAEDSEQVRELCKQGFSKDMFSKGKTFKQISAAICEKGYIGSGEKTERKWLFSLLYRPIDYHRNRRSIDTKSQILSSLSEFQTK